MNTTTTPSIETGAQRMASDYLGVGRDDSVLLVAIEAVRDEAEVLGRAVTALGADVEIVVGASFEDVAPTLPRYDIVTYLGANRSLHGRNVAKYLDAGGRRGSQSFFRAFDVSEQLFTHCFNVPRVELEELNRRVRRAVSSARTIQVTSAAGTDLEIAVEEGHAWTSAFGHFDGRRPGILPPGEVATYSSAVNGVLVCDGALNSNFGYAGDPRCSAWPIRVEFRDSRVVGCRTADASANELLRQFLLVENADRVGEVGFGTNHGIPDFVGFVSHINERRSTLHIGLGSHQQSLKRMGWNCTVHLDLILGPCEMRADSRLIHEAGVYAVDHVSGAGEADGTPLLYADTI